MNERSLTIKDIIRKTIEVTIPALQYPDSAYARIVIRSYDIRSDSYRNSPYKIKESVYVGGENIGFVELGYTKRVSHEEDSYFLEEERALNKGIAELLGGMIANKDAEIQTKKTLRELKARTEELERKQVALNEILSSLDLERDDFRKAVFGVIKQDILPQVHALKHIDLRDDERRRCLDALDINLERLITSTCSVRDDVLSRCTSREIEVITLIRNGHSNKEIAEALHISLTTVERHRHNIRKKLGIAGESVNLARYLHRNPQNG